MSQDVLQHLLNPNHRVYFDGEYTWTVSVKTHLLDNGDHEIREVIHKEPLKVGQIMTSGVICDIRTLESLKPRTIPNNNLPTEDVLFYHRTGIFILACTLLATIYLYSMTVPT